MSTIPPADGPMTRELNIKKHEHESQSTWVQLSFATQADLLQILEASLKSDPVVRNSTQEETQAVLDAIRSRSDCDSLWLNASELRVLDIVLVAMAAQDIDVGVEGVRVESLSEQVSALRHALRERPLTS